MATLNPDMSSSAAFVVAANVVLRVAISELEIVPRLTCRETGTSIDTVSSVVGSRAGLEVGLKVGLEVGLGIGRSEGSGVGWAEGSGMGFGVGAGVGTGTG